MDKLSRHPAWNKHNGPRQPFASRRRFDAVCYLLAALESMLGGRRAFHVVIASPKGEATQSLTTALDCFVGCASSQ
jgi:hypothetical protein